MIRAAAIVAEADCLADLKMPVSDRTGGCPPAGLLPQDKSNTVDRRSVVTGFPRS
jgi:hypothetical protein